MGYSSEPAVAKHDDTQMNNFKSIWNRTSKRKGGDESLKAQLPAVVSPEKLAKHSDAFFLSAMSRCVYQAGFSWKVIESN
jgi:hypothetical protein